MRTDTQQQRVTFNGKPAVVLGSPCSCGGPVCRPQSEGRNKRFQKQKQRKGR